VFSTPSGWRQWPEKSSLRVDLILQILPPIVVVQERSVPSSYGRIEAIWEGTEIRSMVMPERRKKRWKNGVQICGGQVATVLRTGEAAADNIRAWHGRLFVIYVAQLNLSMGFCNFDDINWGLSVSVNVCEPCGCHFGDFASLLDVHMEPTLAVQRSAVFYFGGGWPQVPAPWRSTSTYQTGYGSG
jgi:hypothetical protein